MCWSLYLATVSNPIIEAMSFDEFLQKLNEEKGSVNNEHGVNGMNKKQLDGQLERAQSMLNGFVPPLKGDA